MLRILTLAAAAALVALTGAASAQNYPWKPDKPITIIVPWAAGGSTDQVTRVTAAEIEKALGQKVVVVNQPGASGSIGTRNAMQAPRRTATPGRRAPPRTSAPTSSAACSTPRSPTGGSISTSSTSRCSASIRTRPTRRAQDVVNAMKAKPGQVSVATAGINSSGHSASKRSPARSA